MKRMLIVWLALLLCTSTLLYGQNRNVSFIHGLNGNSYSWAYADTYFSSRYPINTQRLGYSSDQTISSIASSEYGGLLNNTVVVAHSMGGLVSREMVRTHPSGKIKALITVGTPHTGATGATLPGSGNVQAMISKWVGDLTAGPSSYFRNHQYAVEIAEWYILYVVGDIAQILTDRVFGSQSTSDMRPGSAFLQTLNGSTARAFPSAHYALWSREDWNMHYRLLDAMNDAVENGSVMRKASRAIGVYLGAAFQAAQHAEDAYYDWINNGDISALNEYWYWSTVAVNFEWGAHAIANVWQGDWNEVVVGTSRGALDSDGVVRTASQAPWFVSSTRRIRMDRSGRPGINHFEQRRNQDAFDAIDDALRRDDIAVHQPSSGPLSASISGPSSLASGQTGTWTANVSGGSTPYSFQWSYQLLCGPIPLAAADPEPMDVNCNTWHSGGTTSSFSRRVNGSATLRLRLIVTDSSSPAQQQTVYRTVTIGG